MIAVMLHWKPCTLLATVNKAEAIALFSLSQFDSFYKTEWCSRMSLPQ